MCQFGRDENNSLFKWNGRRDTEAVCKAVSLNEPAQTTSHPHPQARYNCFCALETTRQDKRGCKRIQSNTVQLIQVHLTCITKENKCPNEIPCLKHCNRFQMYAPCRIGRESWFSFLNDYDALSLFQVAVISRIGPQPLTQNALRAAQRMSDKSRSTHNTNSSARASLYGARWIHGYKLVRALYSVWCRFKSQTADGALGKSRQGPTRLFGLGNNVNSW